MPRPELPDQERLSPEERRRVTRAALLRPLHLLVAAIGVAFFALTLIWWVLPLTLATYAVLVFLATHDPLFKGRVLGGRHIPPGIAPVFRERSVPPERRVRRLPYGETRRKVEAALESCRRARAAIENSDDATKDLLQDALPKLDLLSRCLVDAAGRRERAAATGRDSGPAGRDKDLRSVDAGLSDAFEKASALRTRVVRISTESDNAAREAADRLNVDLDETIHHLEALLPETPPPERPDR